jgi:hypothetical protein
MVRENYSDEYEMLKLLSLHQYEDFEALADADPSMVEHLTGYGLIAAGRKAHFFRIGIVESYFVSQAKPLGILSQDERRTEISQRRNEIEGAMRAMVRRCFEVHFSRAKRAAELLKAIPTERRGRLLEMPWDRLLSAGDSPLFFLDLDSIISTNWNLFQNVIEMSKEELRYHISTVNKARADAHSKDISDEEFEKARVSLRELQSVFVDD